MLASVRGREPTEILPGKIFAAKISGPLLGSNKPAAAAFFKKPPP
jgi:hypothetical protein